MLAHTVPEVLVAAAMVAAIALLQTDGHYSLAMAKRSRCGTWIPAVELEMQW